MQRIERLINLIAALLDTRIPMTAADIRENIAGYDQDTHEAFRRAFERDKEALRAMGIPLETVRMDALDEEPRDAYVIPKDRYYLPDLELEPDELAALKIAAQVVLGSAEAAEAGFMKLAFDADAGGAEGPRIVWGADVAAEQPLLAPIFEAVLDRAPVRFLYLSAQADTPSERVLEPFGLVHRRGHWYVVGRDRDRDDVRAFKLSRIEGDLRRGDGTYEIPPGFDAGAHLPGEAWELGPGEGGTAVVRFDPHLRWWAEQNLPGATRTDGPRGTLDVELPAANLDALVSWVLGFGGEVEIVAPMEARARARAHLETFQ